MSGHSKWANIKRKKEANDKVKGALFSKLSRLITLAVLEGGGPDPDSNFKLRLEIDKARSANMPKENISRAIEKGSGPNKALIKEVYYEGFGPHGTAFIIQATTDNPNRTVNEIKNTLDQAGGKLGGQGSVSYLFKKCGIILIDKKINTEDQVFTFSERIQAFDMDQDEEYYSLYIPFEQLGKVKEVIGDVKSEPAEIYFKPIAGISLPSEKEIQQVVSIIDLLESLNDVHKVFSNMVL